VQDTDAKGFERALSRLCGGFDVPLTDPRREAYWRSFRKLSLLEFTGLVDTALVESTFASMPTVGALWELHRKVQSPTSDIAAASAPSIQAQLCEYAAIKLKHLCAKSATPAQRWQYSRPWTYCYREWVDGGGKQCAECMGVVIDLDDGKRVGWTVTNMRADAEVYEQVMRRLHPDYRGDSELRKSA
jgi:hypothetical protein